MDDPSRNTQDPLRPVTSVIVLNYNGKRYLNDCFSSLLALDYPTDKLELIMVDNASTDGSVQFMAENFPLVKIVQLRSNLGFAEGNNVGASEAAGEYVAFLNNDTVVDRGWLQALIGPAVEDPRLIVNSKLVYFHRKDIFNIGRGYLNNWGVGFCNGAGEPHERYDRPEYVHHATGGSMLMRRSDFIGIGGFDKDFFAYHEDVDFGWRAWIYGYRIKYIPGSLVFHKSGGTAGAFSPFKTYLLTRNTLAYITKNRESISFVPMLASNIFFNLLVVAYFATPFHPLRLTYGQSVRIAWAILRGMAAYCMWIPLMLGKRGCVQSKRAVSDEVLVKMGLIMSFPASVKYLVRHQLRTVEFLIEAESAE